MSASAASPGLRNPSCNARWASHDTTLETGQGSHGSLSRAETRNFMAAIGPDFKAGFADPAPDLQCRHHPTLAHVAGIDLAPKGKLTGRVIGEALVGGEPVTVSRSTLASDPAANGAAHLLNVPAGGRHALFRRRRLSPGTDRRA